MPRRDDILVCFRHESGLGRSYHQPWRMVSLATIDLVMQDIANVVKEAPKRYGLPDGYEPVAAYDMATYKKIWGRYDT